MNLKKKNAKPGVRVVARDAELSGLSSGKVLLAGDVVFASMQASALPAKGYIEQRPRDGSIGLRALMDKNMPRLHVWIPETVQAMPKVRFGIAIDGYLHWLLKQGTRGTHVLIGGVSSDVGTHVNVLVVNDGHLVDFREWNLPRESSASFVEVRDSMLAELRRSHLVAKFYLAEPLQQWDGVEGISYVGDRPLKEVSYAPIYAAGNTTKAYRLPVAIAVAGLAGYAGLLVNGYATYSSSVDAYQAIINDPAIKAKGGIDTNFVNTMNARRMYMEAPRSQTIMANKAERIITGIGSIRQARVLEMKLPAPSRGDGSTANIVSPNGDGAAAPLTNDSVPDVWLSVKVPRQPGAGIYQSQEFLQELANATHMSVRLTQPGIREDATSRTFDVEGFIHD